MIIGMTKRQQIDAVSFAAGLTARQARDAIDAVSAVVRLALRQDGKIRIDGLGTFMIQQRRPRRVRNPSTGVMMDLPASAVVKFKPTPELRAIMEAEHT
jgi:DNA-binding protein HU-beta